MAVVLNVLLIPRFGMNGAAMSHLLSYLIFYLCLLLVVRWKTGVNIFSKAQLKVLALFAGLFLLNLLWMNIVFPLFQNLPFSSTANALIDAVVRSVMVLTVAGVICYYWNISEEINIIICKKLKIKK